MVNLGKEKLLQKRGKPRNGVAKMHSHKQKSQKRSICPRIKIIPAITLTRAGFDEVKKKTGVLT